MRAESKPNEIEASQRLSLDKLRAWEAKGFGMFLHFGMSTFDGEEFSRGALDPSAFAPESLNVDQWVRTAAEAGMRYAVLTAKHVAGFCLWPSAQTKYHVGHSTARIDIVGAFVEACRRHDVKPGLYYCLWDNRHRFGSVTPSDVMEWNGITLGAENNGANPIDILKEAFTTDEANAFFLDQITELITQYGELFEVWIDIPKIVGRPFRQKLYQHIAELQPNAIIMMNNGFGDGSNYPVDYAWPADIMAIERWLPNSVGSFNPWRKIEGRLIYLPGEVCNPIGQEWFHCPGDDPRSDRELLGMYLTCRSRGVNLLLNVPPDKSGRIPEDYVLALRKLKRNLELLGYAE